MKSLRNLKLNLNPHFNYLRTSTIKFLGVFGFERVKVSIDKGKWGNQFRMKPKMQSNIDCLCVILL